LKLIFQSIVFLSFHDVRSCTLCQNASTDIHSLFICIKSQEIPTDERNLKTSGTVAYRVSHRDRWSFPSVKFQFEKCFSVDMPQTPPLDGATLSRAMHPPARADVGNSTH